ncbi:MAG: Gfo/Idh/MocA family oxidoreductase [Pseudomonadales bacterium]
MNPGFELIEGRKIRFAIVGCGRISERHFQALDAHKDSAEIVAVCDVEPLRLKSAAKATGGRPFDDLDTMLAQSSMDVVVLCTPSGLHSRQAISAAQSGRHVVTEKPMATRWRDGLEMVDACDEARVYLFVVKQNRRNSTLQLLKRTIDAGRFGRIHMVHLNVFWTRPQDYYDADSWRGTWEFDGGALMNQASHYVDLFDWLIGPVDRVQAMTATLGRNIQVEDTGVLNIRWRSGALGSMAVTMLTYPQNMEGSITIIGETGTVRVGGVAVNEIQHWQFAEPHPDDELAKSASYETRSVYGPGHPLYYENVIQSLRGEAMPETDGREGLRSLELLIAAYLSARDGHSVALPLEY